MRLFKKILFSFIGASFFFCGCASQEIPTKKPKVLVSTPPYQALVKKIVKQEFEVVSIVPPKANPHLFEPTSKEIRAMEEALIWFRVGEPFEKKAELAAKRKNPSLYVADLHQKLREKMEETTLDVYDRHYWLSPALMSLQSEDVLEVLSQQFPEQKVFFEENTRELQRELSQLDQNIRSILEKTSAPTILVSHPAFGYFCREYGVVQISLEQEGKEATFSRLEKVLDQAQKRHVHFALALPEHDNKGAQMIAAKLRIPVYWIDPYSSDYFATLERLANLLGAQK